MAGAVALTVAGFVGGSALNGAEAQAEKKAPVILIVDQATLLSQSKAGQTIPGQAEKIKAGVEKELNAEYAKLEKDIADYKETASLMSDEVRKQKEQELQVRGQYALPQRTQVVEQVFRKALNNAQSKILVESQPIMKKSSKNAAPRSCLIGQP